MPKADIECHKLTIKRNKQNKKKLHQQKQQQQLRMRGKKPKGGHGPHNPNPGARKHYHNARKPYRKQSKLQRKLQGQAYKHHVKTLANPGQGFGKPKGGGG
jgi:hypothetical protein